MTITVREVRADDLAEWVRLRVALWPEESGEELAAEATLPRPADDAVFVAERPGGGLCGLLEAAVRPSDYDGIPGRIGYVEGWFVDSEFRRQGVGRRLADAAEAWARERGCSEMHSDAFATNTLSHAAHAALGYTEAARLVHFRKRLT